MPPPPSRKLTLLVALAADALQIVLLPLFAPGALSLWNGALDVVIAGWMIRRLGWHVALLPTFGAELVPGIDLFPTWTAAAWFVTRSRARAASSDRA